MNKKHLFLYSIFLLCFQFSTAQEKFVVYFESNKFDLVKSESASLQHWIKTNKEVKIVAIDGFTDEDGTNGFNDTLAKKRVNFIFSQIKDNIKIREDFKTRSYGENFEQSQNKAENRKVTIYYILQKDLARENEILGINPISVAPVEIVPIEEEAMNFPENASLQDKIQLSRKGTLIRLKDINFYVNTFAVMPSSKPEIEELIYAMNKNPKLKIEIQGHICCVNKDAKNLSLERARQIKRILVSQGINDKRVQVIGFGVSKPKFPIPEKSELEAARNRRVELMILEK